MDALLAAMVAALPLGFVLIYGDAVYLGVFYYVVVPLSLLAGCGALRAAPLFMSGASLAIAISYIPFLAYNLHATRPEGLVGLGHLFSMPGAFAFGLLGAWYSSRDKAASAMLALLFGFLCTFAGYLFNQLAVCNTLLYCGDLFPLVG